MRPLRVVVADDHRLILEAVRAALAATDDIEIVGEALSGAEVLPLVGRTSPDIVLLDVRMPLLDGFGVLERLRKRHPDVKVVMLSGVDDPDLVQRAFREGASAYVLKHVDPRDLPSAIRQAAQGSVYQYHGPAPAGDGAAARDAGLSTRELDILRALAKGLSNKQIAREGWVTEQTVKFHLSNVYRKLGVSNRTEAARYAFEHGIGPGTTASG